MLHSIFLRIDHGSPKWNFSDIFHNLSNLAVEFFLNRIMISQSNYIPWKGFFDAINSVDTYVIYDEVQYTRRDWRNRNKIKTPQGTTWLSIPVDVKGKYSQRISETRVSSSDWSDLHWKTLKHTYSKAPYFKDLAPIFERAYEEVKLMPHLSDINEHFLKLICKLLEIKTQLVQSTRFALQDGRCERILGICKDLKATHYLSGPSAKGYIDEHLFKVEGIEVDYFDFTNYPEYPQLHPPYDPAVTILDLLFMTGPTAPRYIFKNSNPTKLDLNLATTLE